MKKTTTNNALSAAKKNALLPLCILLSCTISYAQYGFNSAKGITAGLDGAAYFTDMEIDGNNDIIMVGTYSDSLFVDGTVMNNGGTYITKFNPPTGGYSWIVTEGEDKNYTPGSHIPPFPSANAYAVELDANNNIYVAYNTTDTVDIDGNTYLPGYHVVVKYLPTGAIDWVNALPVSGITGLREQTFATDGLGNSYFLGNISAGPVSIGGKTLNTPWGSYSNVECIIQIDAAGNLGWVKAVGGNIYYHTLDTDINDDLYFGGQTDDSVNIDGVAMYGDNNFLYKYNTAGGLHYNNAFTPGGGSVPMFDMCIADPNNIIVTGTYTTTRAFGAHVLPAAASWDDSYIAAVDSNGNALWANNHIGNGNDFANSVTTHNGNVILTAQFGIQGIILSDTIRGDYMIAYDMAGNYKWHIGHDSYAESMKKPVSTGTDLYLGGDISFEAIFGTDTITNEAIMNNTTSMVSYFTAVGIDCDLLTVDAGNDTIACFGGARFVANTSYSGTFYTTWQLSTGELFNTGTSQVSPLFEHRDSTTVYVTVQDSATGCLAVDTVLFAAYDASFDTAALCMIDPLTGDLTTTLDAGPGSFYSWSGPDGPYPNTRYITVDTTGMHIVVVGSACGGITSVFEVFECPNDSVWPGDANSDGIADLYDVLNIGIGYNATGAARPMGTTGWYAQWAADYGSSFASGVEYKHADCDGDGTIDSADVNVVSLNYGLMHSKTSGIDTIDPSIPDLYVEFPADSVMAGQQITADIYLGRSTFPITNAYGVAFKLNYDETIVDDATIEFDFSGSWLGAADYTIELEEEFTEQFDLAHSKTDHMSLSGFGKLATMSFYIQDNIAGKIGGVSEVLTLDLFGTKVVDENGNEILVNTIDDNIMAFQLQTSIFDGKEEIELTIYPNPVNDVLNVSANGAKINEVRLIDVIGNKVQLIEGVNQEKLSLSTVEIQTGLYIIEITTDRGIATEKIFVK